MIDNNYGQISGKWINKNTGETINVRSSIIDGNQMIIITDSGKQINMEQFSMNYIQESDDIYDMMGNKIGSEPVKDSVKENYSNNFDESLLDDKNLFSSAVPEIEKVEVKNNEDSLHQLNEYMNNKVDKISSNGVNVETTTFNDYMMKKVFEKYKFNPHLEISIENCKLPIDQLNMLKDIYGVTDKEITKYIYDNLIDNDIFFTSLYNYVEQSLKA